MNPSNENSADQQQTMSAITRRKLTLEHLSARHQQLKQQKQQQQIKDDEITKIEDDESKKVKNEIETKNDLPDSSCFLVHFKGQILGANFQGIDHIYCRYSYICGPDWEIINGELDSGYSQMATRNKLSSKKLYLNEFNQSDLNSGVKSGLNEELDFVWNLPLELTLSSSNVHGWPQILVSVYGLNFFGMDIIRGYGHFYGKKISFNIGKNNGHSFIPPIPGRHELKINLFRPKSSTLLGEINCYLGGKRPEFLDFKCVADGEGREILRFTSEKGYVIVQLDVVMKDLAKHGYVYN